MSLGCSGIADVGGAQESFEMREAEGADVVASCDHLGEPRRTADGQGHGQSVGSNLELRTEFKRRYATGSLCAGIRGLKPHGYIRRSLRERNSGEQTRKDRKNIETGRIASTRLVLAYLWMHD
jgi:hypothetical protein